MQEIWYARCNILQLEIQIPRMTISELKRLKELEEENRRLKEIVDEQSLDIKCLNAISKKTFNVGNKA